MTATRDLVGWVLLAGFVVFMVDAMNAWAGSLYVVHMAASYAAFAVLGAAVLASGNLPSWLGWLGLGYGVGCLAGFAATRFAGPFNPPFLAHLYPGAVGAAMVVS